MSPPVYIFYITSTSTNSWFSNHHMSSHSWKPSSADNSRRLGIYPIILSALFINSIPASILPLRWAGILSESILEPFETPSRIFPATLPKPGKKPATFPAASVTLAVTFSPNLVAPAACLTKAPTFLATTILFFKGLSGRKTGPSLIAESTHLYEFFAQLQYYSWLE